MAKKKDNNRNGQQPFSEKRYIKERLRTVPIDKCYASPAWKQVGETNVVVTRKHKQGTYTVGYYLVDTYCIGVKDSFYRFNMDEDEYEEMLERMQEHDPSMEEVSYNEAHNLVWGAVAFAEEAGIKPDKSFELSQYVLEEDTDDVPLIEYDFGKDGEHFLVANNQFELSKYLPAMRKALGDDAKYMLRVDPDEEEDDDDAYLKDKWNKNIVEEKYHYDTPKYPKRKELNYPQLPEILKRDEFTFGFPDEVLDGEILSLEHNKLKDDLENLTLSSIGDKSYMDNNGWEIIFHAVYLLAEVGDEGSLEVVMEFLRQDSEFENFCFGDIGSAVFIPTLTKLGRNSLDMFSSYLHTSGMPATNRYYVMTAVTCILRDEPKRRKEIIAWWRDILDFYIEALPKCESCDSATAGFAMCSLIHIGAYELTEEVKRLFATGLVEDQICDKEENVIDDMQTDHPVYEYYSMDIHERYHDLKSQEEYMQH